MSRSYFTEDAKLVRFKSPAWTADECYQMTENLDKKGYSIVAGVQRIGCDGKFHDSWLVWREDIPRLIEQLFRQRIVVEVQAEGHGKASINFCYDYPASQILDAIAHFWRNKK